jgi:hypothetical protein
MEKKKTLSKKSSIDKKNLDAMSKTELGGILGGSNSLKPLSALRASLNIGKTDYQC